MRAAGYALLDLQTRLQRGGPVPLDRRSGLLSGALPVRGGCPRSGLVLTFEYFIRTGTSSVELVGEGLRGGKVVRLFHGKRPGARQRIVHKSTESLPHVLRRCSGCGRGRREVGGVRRLAIQ